MPTTSLMPPPKQQYFTALGTPLFGGHLYTYAAGTSTPKETYTNSAGTTKQPNPIPLNVRGEPENPIFWSGNYKVELRTLLGDLVYTVDNYNTDPAGVWGILTQTLTQFAAAAGSSLIGFIQSGVGAVLLTIQDVLRERVSITHYGAKTSNADNRVAIQLAIDATAGDLYVPPGVFDVTLNPDAAGLAGVFGSASVALKPRSNLRLYGPGTIRLKAGQNGTSGAIIGNWDGAPISNFVLDRITLDGNKTNTLGQVSGAVLVDATDCGYNHVKVKDVTYCGLQMRRSSGFDGTSNYGLKDCWATFCKVTNATYIGMQFNRPDGLLVMGNKVDTTGDNAYDIEGDDPTGGQSNAGFGKGIRITDNDADNIAGTAYFIESVGDVKLDLNRSREAVFGAYFNRIHSGALGNSAIGNKFSRKLFPGGNGLTVSNNSGDIRISENECDGFDNSIWLVNTGVYVTIGTNYHKNVGKYMIGYGKNASAVVKSHVQRQILRDLPGYLYSTPQSYPALNPPYNCPSNSPTRAFRLVVEDAFSLESGATLFANFKLSSGLLVFSSGWNAYSIYNVGADAKTRVYFTSKPTGSTYSVINGIAYKITTTSDGSGATYVAQWNGTAYVDGNFTAVLNGALASDMYPDAWTTE